MFNVLKLELVAVLLRLGLPSQMSSSVQHSLMTCTCFHAYKRNYRLRRWFHINQKKRSERLSYGDLPCRTTCPDTDREVRVLSFGGVYLVHLHTFS